MTEFAKDQAAIRDRFPRLPIGCTSCMFDELAQPDGSEPDQRPQRIDAPAGIQEVSGS